MANQPHYGEPRRTIRVSDELWQSALAAAAERGETVPDVVRDLLGAYAYAPEQVRRYLTRMARRHREADAPPDR